MKGDYISMRDIQFDWNEETSVATCTIQHDDNRTIFIGEAYCHEDDMDMISPRTGQEIAYKRAKIKQLQFIKNCEIKPKLAALKHLYGCMAHSSKFNPSSYENTMLQRQIRFLEDDLATVNEMIQYERKNLKVYVDDKDRMYKHIRMQRKGQN
jgi:hypothetical protein